MNDRTCLEKSRTIILPADVDGGMVETVGGRLAHLVAVAPNKPAVVFLCSSGGSMDDGLAIADMIAACPCPVHVVGVGGCYSMAAVIVALAQPGRRWAGPHCAFMFHGVHAAGESGSPETIIQSVEFLSKRDKALDLEILGATRLPKRTYRTKMQRKEEFLLTAEEAVKSGVVDGIWTPEVSADVYAEIRRKK